MSAPESGHAVRATERARRLQRALRHRFRIRRAWRFQSILAPADLLTLTNGFMGLLTIAVVTGIVDLYERPFLPIASLNAPGFPEDVYFAATIFLTIGLVCDALDGIVARKWGASRLGGDLDTLSDEISFVVTPAVLVLSFYGDEMPFRSLLAAGLLFVMGTLRLARFNANPVESETKTFQGLPTPMACVVTLLTILVGVPGQWALPLLIVIAFLMMSNVAYPKSRGRARYLTFFAVALAITLLAVMIAFPEDQPRVVRGTFVFITLGVALVPLFLARQRRRARPPREPHDREAHAVPVRDA